MLETLTHTWHPAIVLDSAVAVNEGNEDVCQQTRHVQSNEGQDDVVLLLRDQQGSTLALSLAIDIDEAGLVFRARAILVRKERLLFVAVIFCHRDGALGKCAEESAVQMVFYVVSKVCKHDQRKAVTKVDAKTFEGNTLVGCKVRLHLFICCSAREGENLGLFALQPLHVADPNQASLRLQPLVNGAGSRGETRRASPLTDYVMYHLSFK